MPAVNWILSLQKALNLWINKRKELEKASVDFMVEDLAKISSINGLNEIFRKLNT